MTRQRFRQGESGNPRGRPRGSRNRSTVLRDRLREQDGQRLIATMREKALAGDTDALKFLLSRILPPAKELPEPPVPNVTATGNGDAASNAEVARQIVEAALRGEITDTRAKELTAALSRVSSMREVEELEERIRQLEEQAGIYEKST